MQQECENFTKIIFRLSEYAKYKGITFNKIALKIGLSNSYFSKMLKNNGSLGEEIIRNILLFYDDISPDWLLLGKGDMLRNSNLTTTNQSIVGSTIPNKGVPLIPLEAIAGLPKDDNIGIRFVDCEHYLVPEFITQGVEYMVRVSGSSMYPKYSNGDILACKRINDILFFQWGKIYVIDSSQGVLVKRIFEDIENIDYIILSSDNKEKYPSFSFPKSDIRSLSIVVGVIRLE